MIILTYHFGSFKFEFEASSFNLNIYVTDKRYKIKYLLKESQYPEFPFEILTVEKDVKDTE